MTTKFRLLILFGLLSCGLFVQPEETEKPLKVRAIYPVGTEILTKDQITIEFNQNVVALGASIFVDDVVPIAIEPELDCEWNWVKLNTIQCDLPVDSELAPATKYTVTVSPGIQSPRGQTMAQEYVHEFSTITPAIRFAQLESWISPTQPIVEVMFNLEIEGDSLLNRIFLYDSDSGREVPVLVKQYSYKSSKQLRQNYFGRAKEYQTLSDFTGSNKVYVLPAETLSPGTDVAVILMPGVATSEGNLRSTERLRYDTSITTYGADFRLLGFICHDVFRKSTFVRIEEPTHAVCNVSSPLALAFTSRFSEQKITDYLQVQPPATFRDTRNLRVLLDSDEKFEGTHYGVSGILKPNTTYRVNVATESPQSTIDGIVPSTSPVYDGFGRPLVGPNHITFKTARAAPQLKLDSNVLVVNAKQTFDPPFYGRNVEDVIVTFDMFDQQGVLRSQTQHKPKPALDDVVQTQELGLRSLLRSPSGTMYGKIQSRPRFHGPIDQLEEYFFIQATPYSVYFKLGEDRSLAWVVDLVTGEPVVAANVEFYKSSLTNLFENPVKIVTASTDRNGLLPLPGFETFDPRWNQTDHSLKLDCGDGNDCSAYFLQVATNDGLAILPLIPEFRIDGRYRFEFDDYLDHWATTTQKLYQPGETVEIKGYVRQQHDEQRIIPTAGNFALCVEGPDGYDYELRSVTLNEFGAYNASLQLTEQTPFGDYELTLVHDPERPLAEVCAHVIYGSSRTEGVAVADGGQFEVFEFKTNPIRVDHELNATVYERGDPMTVFTTAELHAGGPYAQASGRVIVTVVPEEPPIYLVDTDEYEFGGYDGGGWSHWYFRDPLLQDEVELNLQGEHIYVVESLDSSAYYGDLIVESAVASDRGKYVASRSSVPYYGVDQFVGIKRPAKFSMWVSGYAQEVRVREPWSIVVRVVSKDQRFVTDKAVSIKVSARGEGSNGFYDWDEVFACEVVTGSELHSCEFTPPEEDYYRIDAEIVDSKGRQHRSRIEIQAIVDEHGWLDKPELKETVRLELSCSTLAVEVGDAVRCEVKNHFDNSPILVTVERSGVIDQWLETLDDANPVVEFKVLESYAPHFRLSVLSTAPRREAGHVGNFFQGSYYQVATKAFSTTDPRDIPLTINVATEHAFYNPRDAVQLSINVEQHYGSVTPVEYSIAVVDASLLDLSGAGEEYYNPTLKKWRVIGNGVQTYGLIKKLMNSPRTIVQSGTTSNIQRSSIAYNSTVPSVDPVLNKKTNDPRVRRVDRLIAYWNPSVIATDEQTQHKFVLPDNLTSWNVMVMAVSADDRFGFGSTSFASVKDTELRAVTPNVVTEGDQFHAGASIYNRADRHRTLTVELQAEGMLAPETEVSYRTREDFGPRERKSITMPLIAGKLPLDFENRNNSSEIRVVASVSDSRDGDAIDIRVPVRSSRFPVSSVVYGALDSDSTSIPIKIPEQLRDQNGELKFSLTTDEKVNFDGVYRYVRDYPYNCWEQQLTRAILAMQYLRLEAEGVDHSTPWPAAESTINRTLEMVRNYQAPNGGMAYFTPRNRYVSPYLSAYTAIAFSWFAETGYEVPQELSQDLHQYLRDYVTAELKDLERMERWEARKLISRFQATIGALVLHALAISNELTETELHEFSDHIEHMDLFGLSHYLMAALKVDSTLPLNDRIVARIMNHRSLVDGSVEFVEYAPRVCSLILHSETRSMCSVLEALTKFSALTGKGIDIGELKELANSVRHARESRPRWLSTQENVFCTNSMLVFSDFIGGELGDFVATVDLHSQDTGVSTRLADSWQFNRDTSSMQTQYSLPSQLLGEGGTLDIRRQGSGLAFYNVELSYLTSADEPTNRYSGFEVHREYVVYRDHRAQILQSGDHVNKGEIVLVNLYVKSKFDRYFVVVDDTVPGGLEPVNFELGTESQFAAAQETANILRSSAWYEEFSDAWDGQSTFDYRELGLQNVRFFAESISRAKYHLTWVGQAISQGEFTVIPTHVEEMYRPVMFGKSEPWTLIVD